MPAFALIINFALLYYRELDLAAKRDEQAEGRFGSALYC
jgi:hypothetical protein